jgi:hypothetical protein
MVMLWRYRRAAIWSRLQPYRIASSVLFKFFVRNRIYCCPKDAEYCADYGSTKYHLPNGVID